MSNDDSLYCHCCTEVNICISGDSSEGLDKKCTATEVPAKNKCTVLIHCLN